MSWNGGEKPGVAKSFNELLKGQQFCLLTTFRKDGTAVPTPMWFAFDGADVVMMTKGQTGKVKRIRGQGKVLLRACNGNGRPLGPQVEAHATVLTDPGELARMDKILNERYGLKRKFLRWALKLAKDKTDAAILISMASVDELGARCHAEP